MQILLIKIKAHQVTQEMNEKHIIITTIIINSGTLNNDI